MQIKKGYNYNQVHLIPRVISTLKSRDEVDTSVDFCGLKLRIPILASPMPDVCNGEFSAQLAELGGLGIIHRFQSIESQTNELNKNYVAMFDGIRQVGCAIGINGDDFKRIEELYNYGCKLFLIDVANGASAEVGKMVNHLYKYSDGIKIIAGNVASVEGFIYLSDLGISAIRVGMASGSVCSTKTETGIFTQMASLIAEIAEYREKHDLTLTKIIADGGIKEPADMCKALALGADVVMCGSIFAGCQEAPGNIIKVDGKLKKLYRGAASFSTQKYEVGKEPKYVEGMETLVDYSGHLETIIHRFIGGLRSSMSYFNARTLEEYKKNVSWCSV